MKKGIIIDMGETIVHNYDINYENALHKVYALINEKSKMEIDENNFVNYSLKILNQIFNNRSYIEFKMIDYIRLLKDMYNINFDVSIEEVELLFCLNSCKTKFVENIETILQYFKEKKYPVILLSNTSYSKLTIKTILGKLIQYFDDVIVSSDYPIRKPNKDIFNIGIKKIITNNKIDISDIYYIGNDYNVDVIGAYNAEINSIWFNESNKKIINYNNIKCLEISNFIDLISMSF